MNDPIEKEVPFITPEYADMMWNKYEIICPNLDDSMRPDFRLRDQTNCPMNLKNKCNKCKFFMGVLSEDKTFSASGVYYGYCNTKNK